MSYGNDKKPVYTKLKKHYCIIHLAKTFASKQMKSVEDSNLLGSWTNSREENQLNSNDLVFRTFDFKKFPPSRFRFKMELNEDGSCKYLPPYGSPWDGFRKMGLRCKNTNFENS